MHSFFLSTLAALICTTLASDYWGYGGEDFGAGHLGHGHGTSYSKGYTKGFEQKGYGDYGSHKYGGWGSYAKGHEQGSQYGSTYGDDHGHGDHGHEHEHHGFEYGHEPFHHHHGDHGHDHHHGYDWPYNGHHGDHFGHY